MVHILSPDLSKESRKMKYVSLHYHYLLQLNDKGGNNTV